MTNKTDKAYNEAKMRTQQKQRVETLGDPRGVKQHNWDTGANEQSVSDKWTLKGMILESDEHTHKNGTS